MTDRQIKNGKTKKERKKQPNKQRRKGKERNKDTNIQAKKESETFEHKLRVY